MTEKLQRPDYQNSIMNVGNSLLKYFTGNSFHNSLEAVDKALAECPYQRVMLLIFDGMGADILTHNLAESSFLRKHKIQEITSVFPPTTSAATTAIFSGKSPLETGWLGWQCFFKEYGHHVILFTNQDYYTKKNLETPFPRQEALKYTSIMETIGQNVKTCWVTPEIKENYDLIISQNLDEFYANLKKAATVDGCQFIVGYWDEPDNQMHGYGIYSEQARHILQEMNDKLEQLCADLTDTLVIVTADHGQLDVENIRLDNYPELTQFFEQHPAIEPRCVAFHLKPGTEDQFKAKFQELFGDDFELMSGDEFINSGLLGEGMPHPKVKDFAGDMVAIATGNKTLQYKPQGGARPFAFKGHHAGLTAKEMMVPLILIKIK